MTQRAQKQHQQRRLSAYAVVPKQKIDMSTGVFELACWSYTKERSASFSKHGHLGSPLNKRFTEQFPDAFWIRVPGK